MNSSQECIMLTGSSKDLVFLDFECKQVYHSIETWRKQGLVCCSSSVQVCKHRYPLAVKKLAFSFSL